MNTRYFCKHAKRSADVLAHPDLNGIDYLEVLDQQAPPDSPRQQTLLIHCLKPIEVTFSIDEIEINGGVRVTDIRARWCGLASQANALLAAGLITPAERDYFSALPEANQILLIRTSATGDFSQYQLTLKMPTGGGGSQEFDPKLSTVEFCFKVECPTDFDCLGSPVCPPQQEEQPVINYLARDYASLRQVLLDRLANLMPTWQVDSPADLGVTLAELLAYAGDYLSYYQDAVATEAYLNTARRRASIRRHARLLDYNMHEGCNARAWVAFQVNTNLHLPRLNAGGKPQRLLTSMPGQSSRIHPDDLEALLAQHQPLVFELQHAIDLYPAHNQMQFYTWGDDECCLPKGATGATLIDSPASSLQLQVGDVLVFQEVLSPTNGEAADADPQHRHAVRLNRVIPGYDALYDQQVVEIEWDHADALPFPLCISVRIVREGEQDRLIENISVAYGNIALVDHGHTRAIEELEPASGHRRYWPKLSKSGLTFATAIDHTCPASQMLEQDPRAALPAIEVYEQNEIWRPQINLLDSDKSMRHFVVEMDNDGYGRLRFGDGEFGKRLDHKAGAPPLQASYRIGTGPAGNVGAEAIQHIVSSSNGITSLRNPLPAQGGAQAENLEQVRQFAPQAFRQQRRAVTAADYGERASQHARVQKARATRRWTGSWHTMFVTVDPQAGTQVRPEVEDQIGAYLDRYRLAGHDVEIDAPQYVPLDIALTVCIKPGYFQADVKTALLKTFSSVINPDGSQGFFHPDRFTFGQALYLSRFLAAAMQVEGVLWVDIDDTPPKTNRFHRWGKPAQGEIAAGQISVGRLEIIRLDNDPNQPENGRIEFQMQGGQ